ncbi:hypothetical protein BCR36DRAFT_408692 [Piromyces finnis]|uniref:Nudix hydrolase domain-containing protein n=1 Tax=Piromyces finnis TaxID=1754191 RepID=A0A1Y1VL29_9FUNG|nr:hypothetical protein BCR36DRAFT_408692 [Piromyces finnis]|eukprot:ORX59170.1 hypothetical protein BCR36DRAFT_408692 [Piromyces finnis]
MSRQISSRNGNRSNRNVVHSSDSVSVNGNNFVTSVLIICSNFTNDNINGLSNDQNIIDNGEKRNSAIMQRQQDIIYTLIQLFEQIGFKVNFAKTLPSPGIWTRNLAIIILTELDASNIKYKKSKYIKTQYEDLSIEQQPINEELYQQHSKNNYDMYNNNGVHNTPINKKDNFSVVSSSSYGGKDNEINSQAGTSQIDTDNNEAKELLWIQETSKDNRIFKIIFSTIGSRNPVIRDEWLRLGANMVTESCNDVTKALQLIYEFIHTTGGGGLLQNIFKNDTFKCPYCNTPKLSLYAFWYHVPLFHSHNIRYDNTAIVCPICRSEDTKKSFFEHLQYTHFPNPEVKETMTNKLQRRQSATIKLFALVVCRREQDGKFLMVDEVGGWGWWLPGGRVDPGETLHEAITRKTIEETGICINLQGVLKVEFFPNERGSAKFRVIFFAIPQRPDQKPKTIPDYESNGACWVSLHQLHHIKLRSSEPAIWFPYVARGGPIYPLDILRDVPSN